MFQATGKCVTWLPRLSTLNVVLQMSPGETKSHSQAGEITSSCACATVIMQLFSIPFLMLRVSVNVLFLVTQILHGSERYLGMYGGGWSWSGCSERKHWVRNSNLPSIMWQISHVSQLPTVWVVHPQFTLSPSVVLWCNKKYIFLALSPVTGTQLLII